MVALIFLFLTAINKIFQFVGLMKWPNKKVTPLQATFV